MLLLAMEKWFAVTAPLDRIRLFWFNFFVNRWRYYLFGVTELLEDI